MPRSQLLALALAQQLAPTRERHQLELHLKGARADVEPRQCCRGWRALHPSQHAAAAAVRIAAIATASCCELAEIEIEIGFVPPE